MNDRWDQQFKLFGTNLIVFFDPETLYQFKENKQQGSPLAK